MLVNWRFVLCTGAALALSRAAHVYPIASLCNVLTPEEGRRIPDTHKHVLWFSGLRGAMAFALACLARDSLAGTPHGDAAGAMILASTFVMVGCLFTTVLCYCIKKKAVVRLRAKLHPAGHRQHWQLLVQMIEQPVSNHHSVGANRQVRRGSTQLASYACRSRSRCCSTAAASTTSCATGTSSKAARTRPKRSTSCPAARPTARWPTGTRSRKARRTTRARSREMWRRPQRSVATA